MTPRERAEAITATRFTFRDVWISEIEKAIIAAVAEEREACAQLADDMSGIKSIGGDIGEAIRARSNASTH